ncbi:MAG: SoxR reducing system RseC family protein [Clostridiales bacterium]|nr:SoxR reducing system RseC family protein [Clostridiales bacterium]
MERIEQCVVHARKKNLYYVKLTKNAKCEGCKACGFGRKNYLIVPAQSEIECRAGDRVAVRMPAHGVKGSYLYLYLLPLACMFAGLMIPYGHGEAWMLLGGGIGLAVGIAIAYGVERLFRRSKKYLPVIVQTAENAERNAALSASEQTKIPQ